MNHGKREYHNTGVRTTAPPEDSPIIKADTSGIDYRTDNVPLIQEGTLAKALMATMVIIAVIFGVLYVLLK